MRPAGEIRVAALQAAWDVAVERALQPVPGATQRDVLARLVPKGMGRNAVRFTWKNLVRHGHLQLVGQLRLPDSPRALQAYVPAAQSRPHTADRTADLMQVTQAWVAGTR